MNAYYNEIDPKAAAWLRELIKRGMIAPGEVDERDIRDVRPIELKRFKQCHFFAGIGVWSYALRLAGWPDDRPVWTGSCPCQPFSAAGKGKGFDDERHLWPAWHWLISECRPDIIFGEQVTGKNGDTWLDLVSTDLENTGYAVGAVHLPACGVGAPHIRQRAWFVADSASQRHDRRRPGETMPHSGSEQEFKRLRDAGGNDGVENPPSESGSIYTRSGQPNQTSANIGGGSAASLMDNAPSTRRNWKVESSKDETRDKTRLCVSVPGRPVNGHWSNAEWVYCKDGKHRAIEPGTFPLAHGASQRVGRLRGYGNAIVATAAQAVIESYMSITPNPGSRRVK